MIIGFIGQGFIGKNYADAIEERGLKVVRYSLEPQFIGNKERIRDCDIVFIAVPTPTTPSGFDASNVRSSLALLCDGATAVIKSTIVPGTTEALQSEFPNLFVFHSPEFLTEHRAAYEVRHPIRNIVGIPRDTPECREKAQAVMDLFAPAQYQEITSAREAELIKYAANCILYTKVVFMNLLYDVSRKHSCNWETIREALKADPRIGPSHLDPVHKSGPTAQTIGRGAGGHCFIKDFESFRRMYAELEDEKGSALLDALMEKNNELLRSTGKDVDLLRGVYGDANGSASPSTNARAAKKIVTICGGSGSLAVLSGLKKKSNVELSAIVSVADDGGSTGRLRDAYGYLPPGDTRQALVALSDGEDIVRQLFSHRFSKGDVSGHNLGNLNLTALTEIVGSDTQALLEAARLLQVRAGSVVPVSDTPVTLCAEYAGGVTVEGQFSIKTNHTVPGPIKKLYAKSECAATSAATSAIQGADVIVLGPGDLYSSILANFVVRGLPEAVQTSRAKFVYVANLFSTRESSSMTLRDYVSAVESYVGRAPDWIIVNNVRPNSEIVEHCRERGQLLFEDDLGADPRVVRADLIAEVLTAPHAHDAVNRSLVRHDSEKLANVLITLK